MMYEEKFGCYPHENKKVVGKNKKNSSTTILYSSIKSISPPNKTKPRVKDYLQTSFIAKSLKQCIFAKRFELKGFLVGFLAHKIIGFSLANSYWPTLAPEWS